MSSIGSSSFGIIPGTNPYAGSLRGNSDSDAARVSAADRAIDSDQERFTDRFLEADQSEKSDDRDADGSYVPTLHRRRDGSAADESSGSSTVDLRPRSSSDEHIGNLIDVEA